MFKFIAVSIIIISILAIISTFNRKSISADQIAGDFKTPVVADTISIEKNRFIPTLTTVKVGEAVTFVNNDTTTHEIVSDPPQSHIGYPPLNLGLLASGASQIVKFTQRGSFGYHDNNFPQINGKVVVE